MTPAQFVQEVKILHEPYLPQLVAVCETDPCSPNYNSGEWHEPSAEEQAASLQWWCDGCRLPAERCQVAHLLALVEAS